MNKEDLLNNIGSNSGPNINPFEYPSEVCSCGNEVFVPGVIFKKIPGVLIGQGSETAQVPIKVFCCSKCGELSPYDKEMLNDIKKTNEETKKTNLII
jgi:hypothetical protein